MTDDWMQDDEITTESQWLECTDPYALWAYVVWDQVSERRLRLFGCACCRRVFHLLADPRSREGITAAEAFADGLLGTEDLQWAHDQACSAWASVTGEDKYSTVNPGRGPYSLYMGFITGVITGVTGRCLGPYLPRDAAEARQIAVAEVCAAAAYVARKCRDFHPPLFCPDEAANSSAVYMRLADHADFEPKAMELAWKECERLERRQQCFLVCDIIGNPFRPMSIPRTILHWRDGAITRLAQQIYEDRAFADLPLLADALEEAGCRNAEIVAHCRSAGPHILGCWVLDLILGKE